MQVRLEAPPWAEKLVSDLTDMDRDPRPVSAGEVVEHELPDDAYFEYGFVGADGKVRPDPQNEQRAKSVWYGEVSYLTGPEYEPDELAQPPADLARGEVDRLRLESALMAGQTRRVTVYTPADLERGAATPLAVVQDGVAMMRIGSLHLLLEALVERGEVAPLRLAFIEPIDRMTEYAFDESYLRFVAEELEPELTRRYDLTPRRIWIGASLGALASAQLALRRAAREPEDASEDAVLALSGAFLGTPESFDAYRSSESWLLERLRDASTPVPPVWHLHVGTLEWLHDVNRLAYEALAARANVKVTYSESAAGHNWPNWKNALPDAMRKVLGERSPEQGVSPR